MLSLQCARFSPFTNCREVPVTEALLSLLNLTHVWRGLARAVFRVVERGVPSRSYILLCMNMTCLCEMVRTSYAEDGGCPGVFMD